MPLVTISVNHLENLNQPGSDGWATADRITEHTTLNPKGPGPRPQRIDATLSRRHESSVWSQRNTTKQINDQAHFLRRDIHFNEWAKIHWRWVYGKAGHYYPKW
jgi:hypothetical protein